MLDLISSYERTVRGSFELFLWRFPLGFGGSGNRSAEKKLPEDRPWIHYVSSERSRRIGRIHSQLCHQNEFVVQHLQSVFCLGSTSQKRNLIIQWDFPENTITKGENKIVPGKLNVCRLYWHRLWMRLRHFYNRSWDIIDWSLSRGYSSCIWSRRPNWSLVSRGAIAAKKACQSKLCLKWDLLMSTKKNQIQPNEPRRLHWRTERWKKK